MTGVMLFCVAEEAKPFVRKISNHHWAEPYNERSCPFYIAETYSCPESSDDMRKVLKDDEPFETQFIGASVEQCQEWVQEHQSKVRWMIFDMLFIADQRSAEDETLLIKYYNRGKGVSLAPPPGQKEDVILPPDPDTWYEFRVHWKDIDEAQVHLNMEFNVPHLAYPLYFQYKEKLTDDRGVFDVGKALRVMRREENLESVQL